MNSVRKFIVFLLVVFSIFLLIISFSANETNTELIGIKERSLAVSKFKSDLSVGGIYAFPGLIPLTTNSKNSDLFTWSSYDEEHLRFVFYSNDITDKKIGESPWECDGVELYLSKSKTDAGMSSCVAAGG